MIFAEACRKLSAKLEEIKYKKLKKKLIEFYIKRFKDYKPEI